MSVGQPTGIDAVAAHSIGRQEALNEANSLSVVRLEGEMRDLRVAIEQLTKEVHNVPHRAMVAGLMAGIVGGGMTALIVLGSAAAALWVALSGGSVNLF